MFASVNCSIVVSVDGDNEGLPSNDEVLEKLGQR